MRSKISKGIKKIYAYFKKSIVFLLFQIGHFMINNVFSLINYYVISFNLLEKDKTYNSNLNFSLKIKNDTLSTGCFR
jgi:hypothetical protein